MKRLVRALCAPILACALALGLSLPSAAQDWPMRQPVKIVVPFGPGSTPDLIGRLMADHFQKTFGQAFVVENKPGAGGNRGTDAVAKAEPDGYTLLYSPVGIAINPTLFPKVNYRIEDFVAITEIGEAPLLVVVNNSLPVRSLGDFIKLARAHPGNVRFASSGTGSSSHLASEVLGMMAGLRMIHVPYKGGPQAMHDVIGGQLEMVTLPMPETLPQVRAGRVRALGQTGIKRSPNAPDIPTLDEAGLKGYTVMTWYVVFAPAKTSDAVVQRIHAEFDRALRVRDVQDRLRAAGITEIVAAPPEAAAQFVRNEYQRWGKVIRELGIKAN